MSTEAVARFLALLKEDQPLLDRLRPVADREAFDRLAAELGHERGLEFTAGEFSAAVDEALSRQPAEVTEEELRSVAGGTFVPSSGGCTTCAVLLRRLQTTCGIAVVGVVTPAPTLRIS